MEISYADAPDPGPTPRTPPRGQAQALEEQRRMSEMESLSFDDRLDLFSKGRSPSAMTAVSPGSSQWRSSTCRPPWRNLTSDVAEGWSALSCSDSRAASGFGSRKASWSPARQEPGATSPVPSLTAPAVAGCPHAITVSRGCWETWLWPGRMARPHPLTGVSSFKPLLSQLTTGGETRLL
jgi:hypothetical protein